MRDELLPQFTAIPAGEFSMGADDGDEDERPAHRVRVEAFELSMHAVTIGQYAEFVRQTGHPAPAVRELPQIVPPAQAVIYRELSKADAWRNGDAPRHRARHPVTLVTWSDAVAYCRWLSEKTEQVVRLPTEAEWERAARGGIDGRRYPWGDDIDPSRANFLPDPSLKRHRGTRPVGSYPPAHYELYDIVGNVWEWVFDPYRADAYRTAEPSGSGVSRLRVVRGGSWVTYDVSQLRCAHRHRVPADTYAYSIGFRVARG
jgi:formylglycine-generating enzyme required for sulfatase activity